MSALVKESRSHPCLSVFTWRHGSHVGVQNNSEKILLGIWFYYYVKHEWHLAIVLYTNMAVSSHEWKPRMRACVEIKAEELAVRSYQLPFNETLDSIQRNNSTKKQHGSMMGTILLQSGILMYIIFLPCSSLAWQLVYLPQRWAKTSFLSHTVKKEKSDPR